MSSFKEHKAYIDSKGTFQLECSPKIFSEEEYQFLRKYGHWCEALTKGVLLPYRPEQEQFIRVARGLSEPTTENERTWWKYQARVKMERENPNKFKLSYQLDDDTFYTREQAKQLKRTMGSVNYRGHLKGMGE